MANPKGNPNLGPGPGRPKGSQNCATVTAKAAFQLAFDRIGGAAKLAEWANANTTDFYKIYGRLIPTDVTVDPENNKIIVEIVKYGEKNSPSE